MAYHHKAKSELENDVFASRMRMLADTKGCTQAEIAKSIGCTYQAIGAYMKGMAVPTITKALKIAEYFDVSLDYLMGQTDTPYPAVEMQKYCKDMGLSVKAVVNVQKMSKEEQEFLNDLLELESGLMLVKSVCEFNRAKTLRATNEKGEENGKTHDEE